MNEHVLTVTLLTQAIQELLEAEFPLVQVVGEVSNYKRHQSGHRYFTLKDDAAQIRCVLWRGRPVPVELYDGMQVNVRGRITVYPLQGIISSIVILSYPQALVTSIWHSSSSNVNWQHWDISMQHVSGRFHAYHELSGWLPHPLALQSVTSSQR